MGYTASFLYNETYGVAAVNKITERLTGAGVNPVPVDQANYSTTDLNKVTEAITDSGVSYNTNSCRVIKDTDSTFKILYGSAFFNDGSAIDVDSNGVTLPILSGKNYVYFKKDDVAGVIEPVSSNTAPSSGDILLAEYENGVLTDKRSMAVSKIGVFGNPITQTITDELYGTYNLKYGGFEQDGDWYLVKEIPIIKDKFKYARFYCGRKEGITVGSFIKGGYYGEILSHGGTMWSGGGSGYGNYDYVSIVKGQGTSSAEGVINEPLIYIYDTDFIALDFQFKTPWYATMRIKKRTSSNTVTIDKTIIDLNLTLW